MTTAPVPRLIRGLAVPTIISMLVTSFYVMADTYFVGKINTQSTAAVGISFSIMAIIQAFGFFCGHGSGNFISRRLGARDYRSAEKMAATGFFSAFLIGCAIALVGLLFLDPICRALGSTPTILPYAKTYLGIILLGAPFMASSLVLNNQMRLQGNAVYAMIGIIVGAVLNIGLDPLLIFVFDMGIAGAAIGSSLAELVSVIFFVVYTRVRVDVKKYGLNRFGLRNGEPLGNILNISVWTMVQNFISMSTWFLFFIAVEHLGERSLAITNIIRNVSALPFMIVITFSSTCSTLISNLIGAGNTRYVRGTLNQCIRMAYLFVLPIILFFILCPNWILRIYTDMPDLISASLPSLFVLCSAYIFIVPGNVYFQSVSGTGNTRAAFILELMALVLYVVYVAIMIFYLRVDVAICWTTEHIYAIGILLFSAAYMKWGKWENKKI